MIDALVLAALACGLIAAWRKDRTAWALLGSLALTSILRWCGISFDPLLWWLIDVAVIALIAAFGSHNLRDWVVMLLFLPAWCLYVSHLPYGGDGVNLIVSVQLFLTTPVRWILSTYRERARHAPDHWTEFDLRAAHDAA